MKKLMIILSFLILIIIISISFVFISRKKDNNTFNSGKNSYKVKKEMINYNLFHEYYDDAIKIVNDMSLEEKVGQVFLVRYNKYNTREYNNYYPGGYILFARDFEGHSKGAITNEIGDVQKNSKYPMIIGVDEEGGTVVRVSKYYRDSPFERPRSYYDKGGYELLEKIEDEKATLLKEIGINLNLAPVADVSTSPNDFIFYRSFGDNADETSTFVKNMVSYANKNKINSCLKHFPGYGNNVDTHTGIAIDERDYNSFVDNDYKPFSAGINEGVPSILVSHNVVKSIDPDYPSSLSEKVVAELRNKLNFTGIIMTDDLAMDAVKKYVDNGNAATLALNAGCDMIITSDFVNMKNEVLESLNNGLLDKEKLNDAVVRIIAWKYYSGLFSK